MDWSSPSLTSAAWRTGNNLVDNRERNGSRTVRWELCDQYDIRALDEDELYIPGADEEVRNRLEKKALFKKHLEKAGETGKHEE